MRRLLLFAALFGAGLALLIWLQGDWTGRQEPSTSQPDESPAFTSLPLSPAETAEEEEPEDQQTIGLNLSGPQEWTINDETGGRKRYHLTAIDIENVGDDILDLKQPILTIFGEEPNEETAQIYADICRARLAVEEGQPAIDEAYPLTLHGAEVKVRRSLPLGPATIRVPVLEGLLGEGNLRSRERVTVNSVRINASGDGFEWFLEGSSVVLHENGRVELEIAGGERATVSAAGPLTITKTDTRQGERVDVVATGGAHLLLGAEGGPQLTGDEIRLRGELREESASGFSLTELRAEGAVTYAADLAVFSAQRARFAFDQGGRPRRAYLEEEPEVRLELSGREEEQGQAPRTLEVLITGQGPLELGLAGFERGRGSFELAGPAQVGIAEMDGTLTALGGLTGTRTRQGGFASLEAWGGARATFEEDVLDAATIVLGAQLEGELLIAATLESLGRSVVRGQLEDGTPYRFVAGEGIEAQHDGERLLIRRAGDAAINWGEGDDLFSASAETVRDFNAETRALVAQGQVVFEGAGGVGRGDRLVHAGGRRGTLEGSQEIPARFEFAEGVLSGQRIAYEEDGLRAQLDAGLRWNEMAWNLLLDAGEIDVRRAVPEPGQEQWRLTSTEAIHARLQDETGSLTVRADWLTIDGAVRDAPEGAAADAAPRIDESSTVKAGGQVTIEQEGASTFTAEGETLSAGPGLRGELRALASQRVHAAGTLPGDDLAFDLTCEVLWFREDHLEAEGPVAKIMDLAPGAVAGDGVHTRAVAGRLYADQDLIRLSEGAYLGRLVGPLLIWSLDATAVALSRPEGSGESLPAGALPPAFGDLLATGEIHAGFGGNIQAGGNRLEVDRDGGIVRISGAPAMVRLPQGNWESESIEIDVVSGAARTPQGTFQAIESDGTFGVHLSYESAEPHLGTDATVQVIRAPVFTRGARVVRASWALFWVDKTEWAEVSNTVLGSASQDDGLVELEEAPPEEAPVDRPQMPSFFGQMGLLDLQGWLKEAYFDGNIELLVDGQRRARAGAAYMDLVEGHGWLWDVNISVAVGGGGKNREQSIQADWLRHSTDGSLRADSAVMTSCGFEKPHFQIRTGDLVLKPREGRRGPAWEVRLRKNAIDFRHGPSLPLPEIGFEMDEKYNVATNEVSLFGVRPLSFGTDARFGTFVSTTFREDLGGVAKVLHSWLWKLRYLAFPLAGLTKLPKVKAPPLPEGETTYKASFLGSRGGLLDVDAKLRSPGLYWFDADLAVVYDTGKDRGLIRVPEDDRSEWRSWLRAHGRFLLGETQWMEVAFTKQSDAGVQAEFFQSSYLRYEQRESYLQWRKAEGDDFTSTTVKLRANDFQREVEELPSIERYWGREEVGRLGELSLLYAADARVDYLRRRNGDPDYEPAFSDGLGNRNVLRFDTTHRLEAPTTTGVLGLRATPYLDGRATAWDRGTGDGAAPTRLAVLAGLEFATVFWRDNPGGSRHQLTPSINVHTDVLHDDHGATPVYFDEVEYPLQGTAVDLRLRSIWTAPRRRGAWDLELAGTHAEGPLALGEGGWQPLEVNTEWFTTLWDVLVGISHDARYDIENGDTVYSRSFLGLEPTEDLRLGAGFHFGRDQYRKPLFNALSASTRYRANAMYELEARETISKLDDGDRLSSRLILRRFGHDFVFETEVRYRAGEGGTSVQFNLTPLLLYSEPGFSFVDRWRKPNR